MFRLSKVNLVWASLAVSGLITGCGTGTPSSSGSASATASASLASPTASVSASPTQTHAVASCPGLVDNSSSVTALDSVAEPVYYLFACYDERIIVRIDGSVGHVVHVPIQSEYNYGVIDFSGAKPVESIVYSNGLVSKNVPTYWGAATDLHADKYARVVGPTTDVTEFYAQDCKDFMQINGTKTCKKMKSGLAQFFDYGDKSNWKNGLPN